MNATLTLSAWEFASGLQQSEEAANKFANNVQNSANRANASISKVGQGGMVGGGAARALQQVGFGMQDFSSQLETRGLSGAISAVSNNVQMLGAAFGPVGLAISAVGGALAGIFLPKLIESSGLFKDNKKEVEAYSDSLSKWRAEMEKGIKTQEDLVAAGSRSLDQQQADRKKAIDLRSRQAAKLIADINRDDQIVTDTANAKKALDNQGGFASFFGASQVSDNGAGVRAEAARKELAKVQQEQADLNRDMSAAEKMRPKVEQADAAKDKTEEISKRWALEEAAVIAVEKLREQSLEKYGDSFSKLQAKHLRERKELEEKIGSNPFEEERNWAMAQQRAAQQVEHQQALIEDKQKEINEMGPAAKGSAGVDLASIEGIRAINRAITGKSDQDIAKEQLKVLKDQLKVMSSIAKDPSAKQLPPIKTVSLSGA